MLHGPLPWVCAAHLLLGLLLFDPKPFTGGDNFWYMLVAEAVREGHGYRDIWLPGTPLHTHYPPLYPLLLAGLGLLADSVVAFKLFSLACTTAVVGLTYGLARMRVRDPRLSAGAALLVGAAPAIVEYGHWVLSEATFLLFVMLALYAFVRAPEGRDRRWFTVGGAAAIAAYLTRSAGSPLLLAIVVAFAVRRRWGRLASFAAPAAFVALAWWLYVRWAVSVGAAGATTTYGQEFFYRDPYRPELGTITIGDLWARIAHNLELYVLSAWPQAIGGRDLGAGLAGAVGLVVAGVVIAGALRRVRRLEVPELFFLLYGGLILVWPQAWSDQRLLLPLLPLAGIYIAEAAAWAFPPERARRRVRAADLAVFAVVGFALFGNLRIVGPQVACTRQVLGGSPYACYPSVFADFVEAARWIRQHTEPDAIVINRKPQILYWYGRRRGDVYPFTADRDSVVAAIEARGARYVVVDNLSATTWRYLVPAIQARGSQFRVLHTEGRRPTYVVEYQSAAP